MNRNVTIKKIETKNGSVKRKKKKKQIVISPSDIMNVATFKLHKTNIWPLIFVHRRNWDCAARLSLGEEGGESHMKGAGTLVVNFEF